jgi:hypothetical protein
VVEFCNSHVGEETPYHWPLRASPELLRKHGSFFAWCGMKLRPLSRSRAMMSSILGGGGAWPCLNLGCADDDLFLFVQSSSEEEDSDKEGGIGGGEDGEEGDGDSAASRRWATLDARHKKREEAAEAARIKAAARLLQQEYAIDREDCDSEYEPPHKYCEECGCMSRQYAEEDLTEEETVVFDPADVCDCPSDVTSEEEPDGEEVEEVEEGD